MKNAPNKSNQGGQMPRGAQSKRLVFRRTLCLMLICGVGLFIPLFHQLWDIAILHHDDYQKSAIGQSTQDVEVSASRGNILDRNGDVMAMSATVYKLILSPLDVENKISKSKFKDEDGNVDLEAWQAAVDQRKQLLIDGICSLVDVSREKVENHMSKSNHQYEVIAEDIEKEQADKIREFLVANDCGYDLWLAQDTKRYYPFSGLAAQTLGFVNAEGGAYGIEAAYDSVLQGTPGRVVTGRTATGVEMLNSYSDFVDAINGYDLTLTIDSTIQYYAERILEEGIKDYDIQNGAFCIVMDPNTGALLAIASSPDFDPNNYSAVTDPILLARVEENTAANLAALRSSNTEGETEEELLKKARAQALTTARNTMWRSKAINELYEPGSTFKAMVLAAALETGVVSESDTFYCPGFYKVAGYPKPISCSKKTGHGTQTLSEALENSCNPAFMQIGQRLGVETFYQYFEAFGMTEKTEVDLPGGESPINWGPSMTGVDLAVASFGQRFKVSPLQMITGFAAVINGGYLLQPYVVQSVSTSDGTVIQNTETTVVRQVISQQTSQRCRVILESEVIKGTGKNAYRAGCRIGGKTGTSETEVKGEVIVSFMGFAPADDPQVLVLLAYDRPKRAFEGSNESTTGVWISGGNMAAKKGGVLIEQIMDYMGIEKTYTTEESAAVDVTTPRVTGLTVNEAASALEKKNLKYRTIGSGDAVTAQVPAVNASVPGGSTVILYLGGETPQEQSTVPNVVGLSYEAARSKLEEAGLFMRASGTSTFYGNASKAEGQSAAAGESVPTGTVVNVQFANMVEDGVAGIT